MKRNTSSQNFSALPRLTAAVLFLPCFLLLEKNLPVKIYYLAGLFFLYALLLCLWPRSLQSLDMIFPISIVIDLLFLTIFLYFLDRYIHVLATFYLLPIIISAFNQKPGNLYSITGLSGLSYLILAIIQGYWLVPIILQIISFFVIACCAALLTKQLRLTYSFQANQDPLTKVSNRRYFDYHLQRLIAGETPFSLILVDLDDFKQLNDNKGHHHGDFVLKVVAATLKVHSQRGTDFTARFGGDEFAMILPYTSKEDSKKVAEKIRTSILIDPKLLPYPNVSVSLGIAAFPEDADTMEELLEKVDEALYEAKNRGKNYVYVYSE
ncbi:MAG: GGDEF domain-containing protein [Peptococcia bacterium]